MLIFLARLLRVRGQRSAAILVLAAAACVIAGGIAFSATDHVAVTTGLYWAVTTATTVGYGDVSPQNPASRIIAVLVMLTAIPLLGGAFAVFTGALAFTKLSQLLSTRGARMAGEHFRLVVGMHASTPELLEELGAAGEEVVLVADVEPAKLPRDVKLVRGDPTDAHTLREAEPERAGSAVIACESEGDVLVVAVLLRELAPELEVSALAASRPVASALADLGVRQVISGGELVSHLLAKSLEAPHAGDLLLSLLDSDRHRIMEEPAGDGAVGRTLSSVRAVRDELLLGAVVGGRVSLGIGEDPVLSAGDTLLFGIAGKSPSKGHEGAPEKAGQR